MSYRTPMAARRRAEK